MSIGGAFMKTVEKDWEALVEQFLDKDDAVSPAEFCKTHGVSIYEMDLHYNEIMQGRTPKDTVCVEIRTPYKKKKSYLSLEINGIHIRVFPGFDQTLLKEVITVLRYVD